MACEPIFVTVDFTATPGTQVSATLERGESAAGPWLFLREVELTGQVGNSYDTTAPPGVNVWYRWTADTGEVVVQGPFSGTIPSEPVVCLRDPLRPWASLTFGFCSSRESLVAQACTPGGNPFVWVGWGEKIRRADAGLFDIFNSETPADVYGRRKRLDTSIRFLTKTLAAKDAVHALFTAGGPIQIAAPSEYGWDQHTVQPLDLTEAYLTERIDQRRPHRLWSAPVTVVDDAQVGPIQGTECANWCAIMDNFPTYADLTATGDTWQQVVSGETVCGGA